MAEHKPLIHKPSGSKPMALPGFEKIHTRTSIYVPTKPSPGELVIICTWLGAAPKHIAKYAQMYQHIAPHSRILLIESSVPILVSSYAHQRRMIQPSVDVVLGVLAESTFEPTRLATKTSGGDAPPKILLHTFSNGGTNTATQLLLVLAQHTGTALPLTGIMLDSCPAKGTYKKSYDAMVLSLPKDILTRVLGAFVVHSLLLLLYTWIACGNENPASLMRRTLLDGKIVRESWEANLPPELSAATATPLTTGRSRQDGVEGTQADLERFKGRACYLFSKADRMCEWTDITDHAEDARRIGWYVREVAFEGTAHCAHYSKNEDIYTNAAREMWEPRKFNGAQQPTARL